MNKSLEYIKSLIKSGEVTNMIHIIPEQKERFIKVIIEPTEYPCPLAYQLGIKYSCEKVVFDTDDYDMIFSCNDFGCDKCIFKIGEK